MSLEVDPAVLRSAATTFNHAAGALGSLKAGDAVGDAAVAVPSLHTADACRAAAAEIAAEVAALSENLSQFGADLEAAAHAYEARDQAGAKAIPD